MTICAAYYVCFKSSLDNGELLVSLCYKPHLERLAVGIFEGKNLNKLDVYAPPGKLFLTYLSINPLIDTLKPQGNGPSYSNTVIGSLAIDGWAVTFGTARRAWAGCDAAQSCPRNTKM